MHLYLSSSMCASLGQIDLPLIGGHHLIQVSMRDMADPIPPQQGYWGNCMTLDLFKFSLFVVSFLSFLFFLPTSANLPLMVNQVILPLHSTDSGNLEETRDSTKV